jgi:DNA-binding response OmpR family regulator
VLLVDPDASARAEFARALEARAFQVWDAPDESAGLALALEHRPGVIVGDFPLSRSSDFTHAVRTQESLRSSVIITVTDRMLTERDSLAWQLSDRVLAKPIDPERLADEVAWVVEKMSPPVGDNPSA